MVVIPYPMMPEVNDNSSGIKHIRHLNVLSKVAADISGYSKTRLAACIVYKNEVVSFGVNAMKSHPFQAKYSRNSHSVFLHAETDAIRKALKYITVEELERSTLYVCRIKYFDMKRNKLVFGLAKPCCGCERCIATFGIRNVIYTLDGSGYEVL